MWYFLYSHGVRVCVHLATDGALPFGSTAGNYTVHNAYGISLWSHICDISKAWFLSKVAPPSKLGLHYLRKMALYVRTRDGCFPILSWPMWRHIACGKLQLTEDLAWLYFETFDLLTSRPPEERLGWAEALSQCSDSKQLEHQRSKVNVTSGHCSYNGIMLSLCLGPPLGPWVFDCWRGLGGGRCE